MRKLFSWLIHFSMFMGQMVFAQSVTSLVRDDSLKTDLALPFRAVDSNGSALSILKIELVSGQNFCSTMTDPYIAGNFFLKCSSAASVSMTITAKSESGTYKINYNNINITALSNSGTVVLPSTGADPQFVAGQSSYNSSCIACHQNPYDKKNRSLETIKSAMGTVGAMKSLSLSDAELSKISYYLSHLP